MGMRYTTRLFKPSRNPNVPDAVKSAASKLGIFAQKAELQSDHKLSLRLGWKNGVLTADMPYHDGEFLFFRQLGLELGGPWIEFRIQEGSHWDCTLHWGLRTLDEFSTLPEYWNEEEALILALQGRPALLAAAWGIPLESIDQYFVGWGMEEVDESTYRTLKSGKAYPSDQYEYGNYDQLFDVLPKLTHCTHYKWEFEIQIPPRNFSPKRDFQEDLSCDSA